ncbi:MAG: UDP-N-acetylglucosamine 2-epimerase [Bacteroidia bacterium]|nr:UDP-N-acetylglucosamine 2-epimerase [Bacteroidia bacterium]
MIPTILTVIGTRPQYIKFAALLPHLDERLHIVLVDTGQHYSTALSRDFIEEYGLPQPAHVLASGPLDGLPRLAHYLERLDTIIDDARPDALLCFGDTDSALAASLAAVKHGVPVMHVEAGERSRCTDGSRVHPAASPEESNRVLIDHTAALLLCATEQGRTQCLSEGCCGEAILTGDIMYDLYLRLQAGKVNDAAELRRLGIGKEGYYYATLHRAVNTDDAGRFASLLETLAGLDAAVILPLHPRSSERLRAYGLTAPQGALRIIEPVSHATSLALTRNARCVLTDSGGLTREAYFCGVPSICLDDSTAWYELVENGWCSLTGADAHAIRAAVEAPRPTEHPAIFGDGHAAERIVRAMLEYIPC